MMATSSNWGELTESLSTESEKAWHIFSLIVLIGKPIPVQNLVSLCRLFPATPASISSLCSIPKSPITLSNHLLGISSVAFSSFATYLSPHAEEKESIPSIRNDCTKATDETGSEAVKLDKSKSDKSIIRIADNEVGVKQEIGSTAAAACILVHSDHLLEASVEKPNTNQRHCVKHNLSSESTQNHKDILYAKQTRSISFENEPNPKVLPQFESYIVEEEVGSGGYGTVYRARRKNDGALVAIKCPHANAHKFYVNNELKMLERFRGRNFIIQYEECVKIENSYCFVLQYVEHDRPKVLRKEIDVFQLKCYAFCLFKALSNLHKQGIAHRDVKPGNFLFSRKTNNGYLIDFNLAMEMHQNYTSMVKSELGYDGNSHRNIVPAKAIHLTTDSKFFNLKSREGNNIEEAKGSRLDSESKNTRKSAVLRTAQSDLSSWNKINSPVVDGSGITSVKDVSGWTPSAERLREPLPCQGRKELISLAQEAMQTPKPRVLHVPAPMKKRVAASPGTFDRQVLHPTPMPSNSTSFALSAVGLFKNKGDRKRKREGPCSGTKGFKAPEVLFRSQHQGPKIDIWSAGVTLLYLMLGKSPFFGDPEQNIKEIAKLRGCEDLWDVAKRHNRESSFPEKFYGKQSLTSMNLREWCQMNTKRQDFLQKIPNSLYDLVDKCLTVNPSLRITAEDALKHEFFASIHENLRKQRAFKQL